MTLESYYSSLKHLKAPYDRRDLYPLDSNFYLIPPWFFLRPNAIMWLGISSLNSV